MAKIFLAEVAVFVCILAVIALLSLNALKQIAEESRQKKEEQKNLRRRKAEISGQQKLSKSQRFKENLLYNLQVIKMPTQLFAIMEIGITIIGFFFGKLILTSAELALCMAIVFAFLPIVFVSVRANWYKQQEMASIETCMVMINSSYRASRDIVKAVRDNADNPSMPVAFKNFLSTVTLVDSNVERALRKVGAAFNNRYVDEWIEALIKAQYDSNMMDLLPSIVSEMDEAKKAQNESAAAMKAVWREYAMWVVTIICVPLVLKINPEWYNALVYTPVGKLLVVLLLLGLLNTMRVMVKISKPID